MDFIDILMIAVALAMDAFAVAIATGVTLKQVSFRQYFRLGWHFGLFQFMMPVIGWGAGLSFRHAIEQVDHWVAFALLAYVAYGMLKSAVGHGTNDQDAGKDPTRGTTMVMLSTATSLDALAVGLSLSIIQISIWWPAVVIGLVAGCFTLLGMYIGKTVGGVAKLRRYAELAGGLVLLAIGLNILREHGVFVALWALM